RGTFAFDAFDVLDVASVFDVLDVASVFDVLDVASVFDVFGVADVFDLLEALDILSAFGRGSRLIGLPDWADLIEPA
ncbi:hypothetical protein, partial [Nonomuraea sp. NPDC001023]|uniref:hypothetical protein n=1 Tax=Nonomuraea sp. NPDC001023 TaxID=3154770 RepID=UPI0033181E14